jgi:hypothetical protein
MSQHQNNVALVEVKVGILRRRVSLISEGDHINELPAEQPYPTSLYSAVSLCFRSVQYKVEIDLFYLNLLQRTRSTWKLQTTMFLATWFCLATIGASQMANLLLPGFQGRSLEASVKEKVCTVYTLLLLIDFYYIILIS